MDPKTKELVEKFQCPGCTAGSDTECGSFEPEKYGRACSSHRPGTFAFPGGTLVLGLPKGFDKVGAKLEVRTWAKGEVPRWDHLNVPVWAMEKDGYLFVRTLSPRVNRTYVDVVEGGTLALTPHAIDVSKFIDTID